MREIKAINTKKHSLWSQLEQISFMTEIKNPNKTDLQVCKAISLQTMCIKFCQNVGVKRGTLTTLSIMEIKVAKIDTPLNQQRQN